LQAEKNAERKIETLKMGAEPKTYEASSDLTKPTVGGNE
jgi:hypothetical protein